MQTVMLRAPSISAAPAVATDAAIISIVISRIFVASTHPGEKLGEEPSRL
jgi:hypothetical protein